MRTSRWRQHQQSSVSIEPRYILGGKKYGTGKRARTKTMRDQAQATTNSELRKLVGRALADHMRVSLVIESLSHARKIRKSLAGAIFHSDHGSVYTSQAFGDHCA